MMNDFMKNLLKLYLFTGYLGVYSQEPGDPDPLFNQLIHIGRDGLPTKNEVDYVGFYLYTPTEPDKMVDLQPNMKSLCHSTFDAKLETIFLLTGYLSGQVVREIQIKFKNKILREGNYNVIIPDIYRYLLTSYPQAVANTKPIGQHTAQLINFLIDKTNAKAENFTLVGWSLGAHMSGIAGKNVTNLGKIIALDPAAPGFDNAPHEDRLTRSDALFVQVIHTNAAKNAFYGLGTLLPVGHIDFYVDGGSLQPACGPSVKPGFFTDILQIPFRPFQLLCNHAFSTLVYYESIDNSKCKFKGVSCDSYEDFEAGLCTESNSIVAEAGFHGVKMKNVVPGTKFYFNTNAVPPFCIKNPCYLSDSSSDKIPCQNSLTKT